MVLALASDSSYSPHRGCKDFDIRKMLMKPTVMTAKEPSPLFSGLVLSANTFPKVTEYMGDTIVGIDSKLIEHQQQTLWRCVLQPTSRIRSKAARKLANPGSKGKTGVQVMVKNGLNTFIVSLELQIIMFVEHSSVDALQPIYFQLSRGLKTSMLKVDDEVLSKTFRSCWVPTKSEAQRIDPIYTKQ